MSYSSISFLLFVALTAVLYFLFPWKRYKWIILLIASYTFYMLAGYKYAIFIALTTLSTYLAAIWIDRLTINSKQELSRNKTIWCKEKKKEFKTRIKKNKRLVIALVVVLNFGILAFLKYYNFFAGSLNDLLGVFSVGFSVPMLSLFLPLGISFYTFQSIGYVVDVYREKNRAERNFAKFSLFVSFFPQIIQGPISFYDQLAYQLYEPHKVDFKRIKFGCELMLWGFFKKLVIADRAVIVIETVVKEYESYHGATLAFTVLLYAFQLYADFSGGIDISRGVAQVFGINLVENFKRPYFSKTINEYWRRWHITLGAWMKEYIFYPLSLSEAFLRVGKKMKGTKFGDTKAGQHIAKVLPTAVASVIVFCIVGIWHGASWKYVAFGLWNGGIIMLSILTKPITDWTLRKLKINPTCFLWRLFQMLRTFIIVYIGYVFDVAPNFRLALATFKSFIFKPGFIQLSSTIFNLGLGVKDYVILTISLLILFWVSIAHEIHKGFSLREWLNKKSALTQWVVLLVALIYILSLGIYGSQSHISDFVYAQF